MSKIREPNSISLMNKQGFTPLRRFPSHINKHSCCEKFTPFIFVFPKFLIAKPDYNRFGHSNHALSKYSVYNKKCMMWRACRGNDNRIEKQTLWKGGLKGPYKFNFDRQKQPIKPGKNMTLHTTYLHFLFNVHAGQQYTKNSSNFVQFQDFKHDNRMFAENTAHRKIDCSRMIDENSNWLKIQFDARKTEHKKLFREIVNHSREHCWLFCPR